MYAGLIDRVERHITHTRLATTRFKLIYKDDLGAISLKTDTMIGLTALMQTHSAVATALDDPESRRQAINAAVEIVSVSETFHRDEYGLLDNILLVSPGSAHITRGIYGGNFDPVQLCWDIAKGVLEQERRRTAAQTIQASMTSRKTGPGVHVGNLSLLLSTLQACTRQMKRMPPFDIAAT